MDGGVMESAGNNVDGKGRLGERGELEASLQTEELIWMRRLPINALFSTQPKQTVKAR